jgi:hypothetical protein
MSESTRLSSWKTAMATAPLQIMACPRCVSAARRPWAPPPQSTTPSAPAPPAPQHIPPQSTTPSAPAPPAPEHVVNCMVVSGKLDAINAVQARQQDGRPQRNREEADQAERPRYPAQPGHRVGQPKHAGAHNRAEDVPNGGV